VVEGPTIPTRVVHITTIMHTPTLKAVAAAATEGSLLHLREQAHGLCFACRPVSEGGLGLSFHLLPSGGVLAEWTCPSGGQSYEGIVHGGLLATALDSAMVHALFARGLSARTGELAVRYRHSVQTGRIMRVRGFLQEACAPLFHMRADIEQDGRVCAQARGKFMLSPSGAPHEKASFYE